MFAFFTLFSLNLTILVLCWLSRFSGLKKKITLESSLFSQKPFGVYITSSVLCRRFKNNSSSPYTLIISSCSIQLLEVFLKIALDHESLFTYIILLHKHVWWKKKYTALSVTWNWNSEYYSIILRYLLYTGWFTKYGHPNFLLS